MRFPHYPNPVAYIGLIAAARRRDRGADLGDQPPVRAGGTPTFPRRAPSLDRNSRFRAYFLPLTYGLIPVVGADYFARQLPKFFTFIPTVGPVDRPPLRARLDHSTLYNTSVLSANAIVIAAGDRHGPRYARRAVDEVADRGPRPRAGVGPRPHVRSACHGFAVACGLAAAVLYVLMHAAL